jgi:hypothetical protein
VRGSPLLYLGTLRKWHPAVTAVGTRSGTPRRPGRAGGMYFHGVPFDCAQGPYSPVCRHIRQHCPTRVDTLSGHKRDTSVEGGSPGADATPLRSSPGAVRDAYDAECGDSPGQGDGEIRWSASVVRRRTKNQRDGDFALFSTVPCACVAEAQHVPRRLRHRRTGAIGSSAAPRDGDSVSR